MGAPRRGAFEALWERQRKHREKLFEPSKGVPGN
jgi:hypothetical protein